MGQKLELRLGSAGEGSDGLGGRISGSAGRSEVKDERCLLPVNHRVCLIWRAVKVGDLMSASRAGGGGD